jgi:hypothetical protein
MRRRVVLGCALFVAPWIPATSVLATTSSTSATGTATYNGQVIDLSKGWQGAKACLIWQSHHIAECFSTEKELQAREATLRPATATLAATSTCSSSLDLYSGSKYTGSHISFWDEGYWQELSDYGFSDVTRSFIGGACGFHLANGNWGQGNWYPGYTGPWGYASDMGSWDNTVKSIYIV